MELVAEIIENLMELPYILEYYATSTIEIDTFNEWKL